MSQYAVCIECDRPAEQNACGDWVCSTHPYALVVDSEDESEESNAQMPESDTSVPFVLDPQLIRIVHLETELQKLRDICRAADDRLAQFQNVAQGHQALTFRELHIARQLIDDARMFLTKAQETL